MLKVASTFVLALLLLAGCSNAPESPPLTGGEELPEREIDFTWSPTNPIIGTSVSFQIHDSYPEENSGASWDFGDGTGTVGSEVTHAYRAIGAYTVTLEVPGHAEAIKHIVAVTETPTKTDDPDGLPYQPPIETEPPVVTWTEMKYGIAFQQQWTIPPEIVAWDFGDGTTSNEPQPNHIYHEPGAYQVTTTVLNGTHINTTTTEITSTHALPSFKVGLTGFHGAEPTIGGTSSGCIFMQAWDSIARSCDQGETWNRGDGLLSSPGTVDPYLWVDRETDRIHEAHSETANVCIHTAWSDDDGETWLGNPLGCGIPFGDHPKIAAGPWIGDLAYLEQEGQYPRAVYLCYISVVGLAGPRCFTSYDGGETFLQGSHTANTGQFPGAITVAPNGVVYLPTEGEPMILTFSEDNGRTWESIPVPTELGFRERGPNPEFAADPENNVYYVWTADDDDLHFLHGTGPRDWVETEAKIAPEVGSFAFPAMQAFDVGEVAIAFIGTEDWIGRPHDAPDDAVWHLYISLSGDANSRNPHFFTVKLTEDPVQIGSICEAVGDCTNGNRNLLDFIDLSLGPENQLLVSFTDGCVDECATSDAPTPSMSRGEWGAYAIQIMSD